MTFIPVNEPLLPSSAKAYLNQCIDTGWVSSEGSFVQDFEEKYSSSVNRRYGVAVCNGSAALEVAIAALKIGAGDEVIVPSFTIISCVAAVIRSGAKPVVVDADPQTWNMDVSQIEAAITPQTKAIMVVHIYGLPVDMDAVVAISNQYQLAIIEDAAEAHGQSYRQRPCGSFGDISTFSFYANKHVTTGEGGMVLTDDDTLAERCRSLRNLCFQDSERFVHEELGWNFRMSNLQAAIGISQMARIPTITRRKREIGHLYSQQLKSIEGLELPLATTDYAENIYWVYGIVLSDERPETAKDIMSALAKCNIGTRPFFWPMHEQPILRSMGLFKDVCCPVSERLARRGFYLPSGTALTNESLEIVTRTLKEVLA
jgi:perosamine synthetase